MARIAPVNAKGTRDFLPRDLVRRNRVFSLLRETFEHHGYEPLETPAVENTSVLEGKYGEEGDRLLISHSQARRQPGEGCPELAHRRWRTPARWRRLPFAHPRRMRPCATT